MGGDPVAFVISMNLRCRNGQLRAAALGPHVERPLILPGDNPGDRPSDSRRAFCCGRFTKIGRRRIVEARAVPRFVRAVYSIALSQGQEITKHSPSMTRVERPRGLIAAWVCARCAQRRRPAVALTKPRHTLNSPAGAKPGERRA